MAGSSLQLDILKPGPGCEKSRLIIMIKVGVSLCGRRDGRDRPRLDLGLSHHENIQDQDQSNFFCHCWPQSGPAPAENIHQRALTWRGDSGQRPVSLN